MQKDSKPKLVIWVVAAEVPSLRGGAPVRNFNLIKQYAAQGHGVTVFCIAESDSAADIKRLKALEGVEVITVPLAKLTQAGQLVAALMYRVLPFMRQYRASGLAGELLDMLALTGPPDVIQLEQVNGYHAAKPALGKIKAAGARIVLDAHNVEQAALETSLEVFSPLKRVLGKYILPRYRRLENRYAHDADAVFACSEIDRKFFQQHNANTTIVANGVDVEYFKLQLTENKPTLLFMGGTDYPPNADGLRWYIEKIHPAVKKKIPAVKLYIIGGKTPDWLQAAAIQDNSIVPAGYVDDVRDYLKKAAVCISPIRKGSGTSLKLLEYMSSGKAVVSTSIGARGIASTSGKDILLADSPRDFGAAVTKLLGNAARRRSLGNRARTLMVKNYTWQKIGKTAAAAMSAGHANKYVRRELVPTRTLVFPARTLMLVTVLWSLAATAVIATGWGAAVLRGTVVLPIFLLVPGLSLLAVTHAKVRMGLRCLLYGVGLSLAYWMFAGLAYNNVSLWLNYMRPLDPAPTLLFFEVSVLVWTLLAYIRNKNRQLRLTLQRPNKTSLALAFASITTLAASILGAQLLNNNGTNAVTVFSVCAMTMIIFAATIFYYRVQEWTYPVMVVCIGLGLLLLYSLRSWHILGWDINLEYQVFRLTETVGHWSMANAPGAEYNACLSLTILPTILHHLIGGDPEYIYKFTMQLIFAGVPLGVYALCRQYIKAAYAFIAAMFYVGQVWYIEQLPALVRQEIAFIFFVAILLLLFDKVLQRRLRALFGVAFVSSMVVSHYSTTYVWLAIGLLAIVIATLLKLVYKAARKQDNKLLVGLPLVTLVLSVLWFSVYTQTSNNSEGFAKGIVSHASEVFSSEALRGGIQRIGLAPAESEGSSKLVSRYNEIKENYDPARTQYALYKEGQDYVPVELEETDTVLGLLPAPLSRLIVMATLVAKVLFVNVFPIVGLLYVLWAFRKKRYVDASYIAVAAAAFPLIFAVVFFPFIQAQYNLTRLFMQIMIVLALPTVVGFTMLFRRFGTKIHVVLALFFGLFFFHSVGLTTQLVGGRGTITLNAQTTAIDPFYVRDAEVASTHWLKAQLPHDSDAQVYADVLGSLRLKGFANTQEVNVDLFPSTIDKSGYVYLTAVNTQHSKAYVFSKGDIITYQLPKDFLDQNKDTIYSNGQSIIYK